MSDKSKITLKPIFRTAAILNCLSNGVTSITDISKSCDVNKSTLHRLLKALNKAGITMQDTISRRYYIGPTVTQVISKPYVNHEHLVSCAINEMQSLAEYTCENVGLNILIGLKSILLYEIPSVHEFQLVIKNKIVTDLHAGASSKVLLSQLNDKELEIAMINLKFEQITEHTTTSKEELLAQLIRIRQQGYAITYGERIPNGVSIAASINNYLLPVSLSVIGPESRLKTRINDYLEKTLNLSKEIQHKLSLIKKLE